MRKTLSFREILSISSMLFGLFFGAGNLIFPALMGQMAGRQFLPALIGFLATGVGLPILGVIAIGVLHADGLFDFSKKLVGRRFAYLFTCVLYLTIGPFFAIPRCFTVPYEMGFRQLFPSAVPDRARLFLFSLIFFAIMLWFSLRPGRILTWIGKFLTPAFLVLFCLIMITALTHPMGSPFQVAPSGAYRTLPFAAGLLEGYNTMDAIAGLCFGIIVMDVVRSLGIENSSDIAKNTILAGMITSVMMAAVYTSTLIAGAESRNALPLMENGGPVLSGIVKTYFPGIGEYLFALLVFLACIKTAIGLITSCSRTFVQIFPNGPRYPHWAVIFSIGACAFANIGLSGILRITVPVLMLLYPLVIVLSGISFLKMAVPMTQRSVQAVLLVTALCAAGDLVRALPDMAKQSPAIHAIEALYARVLPLYREGFGWLIPACATLVLAVLIGGQRKRGHLSGRDL